MTGFPSSCRRGSRAFAAYGWGPRLLAIFALFVNPEGAHAQAQWFSNAGQNWSDGSNWLGSLPPTNGTSVTIGPFGSGGGQTLTSDDIAGLSLNSLNVVSGYTVNVTGTLSITSVTNAGTLGAVCCGALTISGTVFNSGGTLRQQSGGSVLLSGATINNGTLSGTIDAVSRATTDTVLNNVTVTGLVVGSGVLLEGMFSGGAFFGQGAGIANLGTLNGVLISGSLFNSTGAGGGLVTSATIGSGSTATTVSAGTFAGMNNTSSTSSAPVTLSGVTNTGTITFGGNATTFSGGTNLGTLQSFGGTLILAGTVSNSSIINAPSGATIENLGTVLGGTITGSATNSGGELAGVTIGSINTVVTGGTIAGGTNLGTLQSGNTAQLNLSGTVLNSAGTVQSIGAGTNNFGTLVGGALQGGTLSNHGTLVGGISNASTVVGGMGSIAGTIGNGATLTGISGGTLAGNTVTNSGTSGGVTLFNIINTGTLTAGGSAATVLEGSISNTGTLVGGAAGLTIGNGTTSIPTTVTGGTLAGNITVVSSTSARLTLSGVTTTTAITASGNAPTTFSNGTNLAVLESGTASGALVLTGTLTNHSSIRNLGAGVTNSGIISGGTILGVITNSSGTLSSVTLGNGAVATQINGGVITGSSVTDSVSSAPVTLSGVANRGTLTAGGSFGTVFQNGTNSGLLQSGAAGSGLTLSGSINNAGGTIDNQGAGVTNIGTITGGTVSGTVTGAGSGIFDGVDFSNANVTGGALSDASGTVRSSGISSLDVTNAGAVNLTVTGGTLTSVGDYNIASGKTTTIDASADLTVTGSITNSGKLVVNGSLDPPSYSQGVGGELDINGTFTVSVADLLGGVVYGSPGAAIDGDVTNSGADIHVDSAGGAPLEINGNYTQTGGDIVFDVNGSGGSDRLDVTGTMNVQGGFIVFDVTSPWNSSDGPLLLLQAGDLDLQNVSFQVNGVPLPPDWSIQVEGDSVVLATPEPECLLLSAAGLAALLRRRR